MVPPLPPLPPLPPHPNYHSCLVQLMSFVDGQEYEKDRLFAPETLGELTPVQIKRWMCLKAYGTPDPTQNDHPTEGRSTSLEYYKKALSHYMPNRLTAWNALIQVGNPTRSVEVNDLIKAVKKAEVRKQGKPSSARRALQKSEFYQLLRILEGFPDFHRKYRVPTLVKFQYTMIGRIDDTANFMAEDLKPNPDFPFTLLCRMCWSKNVMEERDAPDQILIGAMEKDFCILVALAIYLEAWIETGDGLHCRFLFTGDIDDGAPKRLRDNVRTIIKNNVFDSPDFERAEAGPLGTHSQRKYPSTYAKKNGCSKEDVDGRGRWRRKRSTVDVYIDVRLPFQDAKVAAALCVGGPVKYVLQEGSGVTNDWLAQYVVPHILMKYPREPNSVGMTLALPLLWACMAPEMNDNVPENLKQRVRTAYAAIQQLDEGVNPVKKVPLIVYRIEDDLKIEEASDVPMDENAQQGQARPPQRIEENLRVLSTEVNSLRGLFNQFRDSQQTDMSVLRADILQQYGILNRNIRRVAIAPARRINRDNQQNQEDGAEEEPANAGGIEPFVSTLSRTPRTLYELWAEYEFGIGGRKPAREFTSAERGRVKYNYHRRKVVWDVVAALVRAGYSSQVAIDRIYQAYGRHKSVTWIINQMRKDRVQGGHPNLRV